MPPAGDEHPPDRTADRVTPDTSLDRDRVQAVVGVQVDGRSWTFDAGFLQSGWSCMWGRGCQGIEDQPDPDAMLGCCSVGARLVDEQEARDIAALGASLDPALFEQQFLAAEIGPVDESGLHTRVVAGRCIFLNSPGFAGGAGCALHLSAVAEGDDPIDWKPSVCWQLPLRVDRTGNDPHLRPWRRSDWGEGGDTMAWCCSDPVEAPEAFTGDSPVIITLEAELRALLGDETYEALREQLLPGPGKL